MIVAHILGIPVEETVVQLVPIGAVTVAAAAIAGRAGAERLRRRLRHRARAGGGVEG